MHVYINRYQRKERNSTRSKRILDQKMYSNLERKKKNNDNQEDLSSFFMHGLKKRTARLEQGSECLDPVAGEIIEEKFATIEGFYQSDNFKFGEL